MPAVSCGKRSHTIVVHRFWSAALRSEVRSYHLLCRAIFEVGKNLACGRSDAGDV